MRLSRGQRPPNEEQSEVEAWLVNQGPLGVALLLAITAITWLTKKLVEVQNQRVLDAQAHARAALDAIKALQDLGLIPSNQSKTQSSMTRTPP